MKVWGIIKNIFQAIIQGKLILRLHLNRHFLKILFCIFLCAITIWISLMIDSSLAHVKRNNDIIKEQQYELAIKSFELSKIDCVSQIEITLGEMGSKLKKAEKPATEIKTKGSNKENRERNDR